MDLEKFIFQTPLYASFDLVSDTGLAKVLAGYGTAKVDGYCTDCEQASTFKVDRFVSWSGSLDVLAEKIQNFNHYESLRIVCARNDDHSITAWYKFGPGTIEKVGQHPSLADIANDEARTYRDVLNKTDSSELHKAIGLAAHGVGVGSFVYLRRLFENLIYSRFAEFQESEGWNEEEFAKLRMDDKVEFLKGHIPNFLYENRKLYGILSRGIHELSEEICLKAFEPLKLSIKIILEEDKKKKEDLELKRKAAEAISTFDF